MKWKDALGKTTLLALFIAILGGLSGCGKIKEYAAKEAWETVRAYEKALGVNSPEQAQTNWQRLEEENADLKDEIEMFKRGEAGDSDGQAAAFRRMLQ